MVCKVYGADRIRYLRCRVCRAEFNERKHTALWNTKVAEVKAVSVGEHLAEGCSLKGTARLVQMDASTVRRLNQRLGAHAEAFHDEQVQGVEIDTLEADERHEYAGKKYATLFPAIFGQPYRPSRNGDRGRFPELRFRIPRRLAHAQIIKHRECRRVVDIEVRYTHGSQKRVNQALDTLGLHNTQQFGHQVTRF